MGQESYTIKAAGGIIKLGRPKRNQNSFEGDTCLSYVGTDFLTILQNTLPVFAIDKVLLLLKELR